MDSKIADFGNPIVAAFIYAAVVAICIMLTPRLGFLPWIAVGALLWASGAVLSTLNPHHGER